MPLDGHAYLIAQGWSGKGTGLRTGAIAKPVTLIKKRTLSGVGKDRDDAFPFWDHVYSAAASAIKIKATSSDDESDDTDTPAETPSLQRTSTGIISNRRPTTGTPALSGNATPSSSGTSTPRISIMAAAKQEAARRTLYSMFFRGPVIRSDEEVVSVQVGLDDVAGAAVVVDQVVEAVVGKLGEVKKKRRKGKEREGETGESEGAEKRKKRKAKGGDTSEAVKDNRGRKRRKLEDVEGRGVSLGAGSSRQVASDSGVVDIQEGLDKVADKAERKRRKEEKRARKEEKRRLKEAKKAKAAGGNTGEKAAEDSPISQPADVAADVVLPVITNSQGEASDTSDPKPRKKKWKKDAM